MDKDSKILITGSTGMVGSALKRILRDDGFVDILTPTHEDLELTNQALVSDYFSEHKPEYVFHLAAVVGGIHANYKLPGDFIYQNTIVHCNVIDSAYRNGAKKLLFPGSACTYPKMSSQPIVEEEFLNGKIEPTNIAYAAAKINGIIMCQSYSRQYDFQTIVPMPTNSYGVGDNFDPNQSHVIPALMKRFNDAKKDGGKEVMIWGSGKVSREFLYVDDLADALLFLICNYNDNEIINVGTMQEITIAELANKVANTVDYTGKVELDNTKPDGPPRKCLDSSKLFSLGWQPKIGLDEGLLRMYKHHFNK